MHTSIHRDTEEKAVALQTVLKCSGILITEKCFQ